MREIIKDPDVEYAIELLKSKGVTLDQITQVYRHYYSNLPDPGTQIQWNYSIKTVLENHSIMYPPEKGYVRVQNSVGTDLYILPHEYRVMVSPKAIESTESAQAE